MRVINQSGGAFGRCIGRCRPCLCARACVRACGARHAFVSRVSAIVVVYGLPFAADPVAFAAGGGGGVGCGVAWLPGKQGLKHDFQGLRGGKTDPGGLDARGACLFSLARALSVSPSNVRRA